MPSARQEAIKRINTYNSSWLTTALDLSGLGLTTADIDALKKELSAVKRLKTLYLGFSKKSKAKEPPRNELDTVPDWLFATNTGLRRVDLSGNGLAELPPAISNCAALQELTFAQNKFSKFPEPVCALKSLTKLDGRGNDIRRLPESFGHLRALTDLKMDVQGVKWPPRDVMVQGAREVVNFVRDSGSGVVVSEAKVVLVGNGDHGKTTLRMWLTDNKYVTRPSTRGGEVASIELPMADGKHGVIHIWDFGGQEQYRAAQRSLFSSDAIFVVVCKARSGIDEGSVPEWLQLIQHVRSDAQVILVFSHMDQVDQPPALDGLPNRLKHMIPEGFVFELDATRPDGGIDAIREKIIEVAVRSDSFSTKRPLADCEVLDAVKAADRDYLTFDEFNGYCDRAGVPTERRVSLARSISSIDAGPKPGLVVVNPEWLLKAVSYVMDDKTVRANNGVLSVERDLERIWLKHGRSASQSPMTFGREAWDEILGIMAYQGLGYRLNNEEWLIPERVDGRTPERLPWAIEATGPKRRFKLDAPIYGLGALMTAQLHRYHTPGNREFWKSGAVFRDPHSQSEMMMEVDGRSVLNFEARGEDGEGMLSSATGALTDVTRRYWPDTDRGGTPPFDSLIPCPNCARGHYSLNAVRSAFRRGNVVDDCSSGTCKVETSVLLYGIQTSRSAEVGDLVTTILMGQASKDEPPRFIQVENTDGRLQHGRLLHLICESSGKVVPQTRDEVSIDGDFAAVFRVVAENAVGGLTRAILAGAAAGIKTIAGRSEGLTSADDEIGASDDEDIGPRAHDGEVGKHELLTLPLGISMRRIGVPVAQRVQETLKNMAIKGGMRQVLVDGRWLWASKQEADRHDPRVAKEAGAQRT